ncbi:MAG TPA: CsiV family protein [Gammaproteobacteria bacterium]|jgi:hypothetical protein|nr:CsiV family protein [Gammaproteobacteria bacterium]
MKSHVVWLAAGLLAMAFGGGALAQPAATPAIPRYQVEIIVFAHRDFDPAEERFPQQLTPLRTTTDDPLLTVPAFEESIPPDATAAPLPTGPEPDAAAPPVEDPLAIRVLTPAELQLNAQYRRITNLGAYRPLLHAGWIQPGLPEDRAQPFDLAQIGSTNPQGSVRVYLSRFLHVSLDLTYEDRANPAVQAPGEELRDVALTPRYHLVAERQVRSGELHYFDHPAFGVLVKVTPVLTGSPGSTGRRPAA